MTLLRRVTELLRSADIRFALIGATAAAVHGVSRATADIDLLAIDPRALDPTLWQPLRDTGAAVEVRRGDASDPLAGVVRIASPDHESVDLVVGLGGWQVDVLARAQPHTLDGVDIKVVTRADLILLKLYAGGPADRWDIEALRLAAEDRDRLTSEIDERLERLPARCRRLWQRILNPDPAD